ncbi:NAD(P)/FAD-dependent oxidoreductase [Streptosporangium jomthongense]|uniref:NAD(P)/FAD-dependent oxidoreductase n=1 Tax=Streptosporangium jomthongense TaxID=1193683 RepID=A0ABV8ET09_9ACTN
MGRPEKEFDLAIIGSGIIGAMIGHLAAEGNPGLRVLTMDDGNTGATHLSAGLDVPTGHTAGQRALAARGSAVYARLRAELPALPIRPVDTYWVIDKANLHRLRESMAGPRLTEADAERRDWLAGVLPGLRTADRLLLRSDGGAHADVGRLAGRLLDEQRRRPGSEVRGGSPVTGVRPRDGRYELTHGDEVYAVAGRVAVATGARAPWGPFGDVARARGLRVKKVAALHLGVRPPDDAPVLVFDDHDAFLLPVHEEGYWLLSFTSRHWDLSPGDGPPDLSPEDRATAAGVLDAYVPALAAEVCGGRAFYDGYTPDRMPLVEPVDGWPGVVLALGGNGSGYRLAPAIAERALELLSLDTRKGDRS